jgi:divalent metal cation (Fe/Co/Zn/Cd) transporter
MKGAKVRAGPAICCRSLTRQVRQWTARNDLNHLAFSGTAMASQSGTYSGSKRVIYFAIAGNLLITATKFIAAFLHRQLRHAGVHSLVDTGNGGLLLYGLRRAAKPADKTHPFGHGRELYFWSFIVALLVFAVGAGVSLYEGLIHIMEPGPVTNPLVNYVILGLAMIFEGTS